MTAVATPSAAVYSPALLDLQATVADSFALVMEARAGVPAKTAFDVATLLQLSADELADLLHTTKTLRAYREGKKRLGPAASEQILKLLALARQGEEVFGALRAFRLTPPAAAPWPASKMWCIAAAKASTASSKSFASTSPILWPSQSYPSTKCRPSGSCRATTPAASP